MTSVERARNGKGQYRDGVDTAERDDRICRLLSQRLSHAEVARREGVSERTVERAEKRGLAAIRATGAKELQAKQYAELEAIKQKAWEIVTNSQERFAASAKKLSRHDQEVEIKALLVIDKAITTQNKLMGLDEPRKSVNAITHLDLNMLQAQVLQNAEVMTTNLRQRLALPAAEVVAGQVE